jgi:AcrR family transcriptional regulator
MRKKSEAKRKAILDVAAQLFSEVGMERGTMAEIAAKAGLTKATVYNYFESKEALFFEALFSSILMESDKIFEKLDPETDDIVGTLRDFGEHLLPFVYSDEVQAARRLIIAEARRSDLGRLCYARGPGKTKALLADFLQAAMDGGKLLQAQPLVAAHQLIALLEAELIDGFQFGIVVALDGTRLRETVDRAIVAFFAIYGRPCPQLAVSERTNS